MSFINTVDELSSIYPDFPVHIILRSKLLVTLSQNSEKISKKVKSKSELISIVVVEKICESQHMDPANMSIGNLLMKLEHPVKTELLVLMRLGFILVAFDLIQPVEMSNEMMKTEFGAITDIHSFNLVTVSIDGMYQFDHVIFQQYLAALHLVHQPAMTTLNFITNQLFTLEQRNWPVTEFYFSLASSGLFPTAHESLFHILSYICQSFNCSQPVIDNEKVMLIFRCLYEAENESLNLHAYYEIFKSHIFSFKLSQLSSETLNGLAYYIVTTAKHDVTWKVYCCDEQKVHRLIKFVERHAVSRKQRRSSVLSIKCDTEMSFGDNDRITITLRSYDYVLSSLKECFLNTPDDLQEVTFESPAIVIADKITKTSISTTLTSSSHLLLLPYGNYSSEQYKAKKEMDSIVFFNMAKELLVPHLQMYSSSIVIESQYRKKDHLWIMLPRNMRCDFYEAVVLYPMIPLHWVKVQQPNGSKELEDKYRQVSVQRYQSPTTASAAVSDTAELVILNSSRLIRCMVTPPTGEDPVVIPFYTNSDEALEYGIIGCDYLLEDNLVTEDVRWKGMKLFDITCDEQVVRELPLPSIKGTELGEMTANTAAANTANMKTSAPMPLKSSTLYQTRPFKAPSTSHSEHQIKRHALEGFDQPGYCFYGDGYKFVVGRMYTLPHLLPGARVLREGGNGTVIEVAYEGTVYAVKNTAFRWREVLILPKLNHHNILPLLCMIMGSPIEMFPRRRYISHFYPRFTNDLGRNVGSYERFCLRSLKERYKIEPLLLKKIQANFKYVSHEILQGLNYLHTLPNPIIHRDIKPSNVLLMMFCDCPNVLACVCRKHPHVVLSDFDASIELSPEGYMQPDPPRSTSSRDFYTTTDRTYHISPVGTIGFKSPEGYIHQVSNSVDVIKEFTTKADIFSFGLLMLLLVLNEEGPKYMNQIGTLLLSIHQSIRAPQPLNHAKKAMLMKNGVTEFRECEFCVVETDIQKILPIKRLRHTFTDNPELVSFVESALTIDPLQRPTASELLNHNYLELKNYI